MTNTPPPTAPALSRPRYAGIGAGYAGLAAAVELARSNCEVDVFESSRDLGGRARRVEIKGLPLDNGQHILVGAYSALLELLTLVGVKEADVLARSPLSLRIEPELHFRRSGNGRLGLVWGLLRARGLFWRDRIAAIGFMRRLARENYNVGHDRTLSKFLRNRYQTQRLRRLLWHRLCVAALNTPPNEASAQVFVNVLRDTLGGKSTASDLLLPKTDLSALFPEPARRYIEAHGGSVHLGRPIRAIQSTPDGLWRINGEPTFYTGVIIASDPTNAARLLRTDPTIAAADQNAIAIIESIDYEPIYTVYLQFDAQMRLPEPMIGMSNGHAQWLFDRGQLGGPPGLIAAVISAHGPHEKLSHDEIEKSVGDEITLRFGLANPPAWTQTIAEQRATFSCRPGLARPNKVLQSRGLFLAGDYTTSDYPSTLEAAVRSGITASKAARGALDPMAISA